MALSLAMEWESFVVEVTMFSRGVVILSREVALFSRRVVILSRGVAMFGRGGGELQSWSGHA